MSENKQWISVSERLPKEKGDYLISIQNDDGTTYVSMKWFVVEDNLKCWKNDGCDNSKITAWMPLPEPYRK